MVSFAGIKPGDDLHLPLQGPAVAAPTGTTAIPAARSRRACTRPSSSSRPNGERHKVARDYVVMLSDHHPMSPGTILRKLKQEPRLLQRPQAHLARPDARPRAAKTTEERQAIISDRLTWGEMRMDPTDLADVTGYTFLVNGRGPTDNWTGLFRPGEKVRLRFINGSAMTMFDVRIPGPEAQGRAGRRQRRAARSMSTSSGSASARPTT